MTREEKIDAFTMRLDGYTLQEIGDKYGVSKERIRQILAKTCSESGIQRKNYIYPNIADWMRKNKVTQEMFSKQLKSSQRTVSYILFGKHSPSFELVNKILDVTKMPYEVAFSKERLER